MCCDNGNAYMSSEFLIKVNARKLGVVLLL